MKQLFLLAQIAGRTVAVASSEVGSVIDLGEVVPAPRAAPQVRGLAALRSRVVTVIDTRAALGLAPERGAGPQRAIVTQIDGHDYAMLVDALDDVAPFELMPLTRGVVLDEHWRDVGRGVIERDGEAILVLALRSLVPGLQAAA